ncbi:hypothetical protein PG279_10030 [Riemerella anatipestifer]|nr:hypothetical protein [Riemerella anatipestifer]
MKKKYIIILSILSLIFIIGSWYFTFENLKKLPFEERGTLGDMFGGLNTLFSGLAFCGIIISILLQSSELKMQRDEIKQNREELKNSVKAQKAQSESLHRQAENLKISAKLSALNTLVNYYTEKSKNNIAKGGFVGHLDLEAKTAEKYIKEIEIILNKKS